MIFVIVLNVKVLSTVMNSTFIFEYVITTCLFAPKKSKMFLATLLHLFSLNANPLESDWSWQTWRPELTLNTQGSLSEDTF